MQSLLLALVAIGLTGCFGTASPLVNQHFDRATGMTVTTADAPMVFARTEGQYSRSARDYLYLGPIETNRQGARDYYLWVGVATTLDRGYLAPDSEPPDALYVEVQGELMAFGLEPWSKRAPGLGAMDLYDTAVKVEEHLAARVSLHQLELLAGEALESIRVEGSPGQTRLYLRWDEGRNWHGFLRDTPASESLATDLTRVR